MGHTKTDDRLGLDGPEFVSTSELTSLQTQLKPTVPLPKLHLPITPTNHSSEMGVSHSYSYHLPSVVCVCIPKQCVILICIFWTSQKWYHTLGTLPPCCPVLCVALCPWCWVELQCSLFHCCIVLHCVRILPMLFIPVLVNGHLGCCLLKSFLDMSHLFSPSPWPC